MKKLVKHLTVAACVLYAGIASVALAESGTSNTQTKPQTIPILLKGDTHDKTYRPKMPSRQQIECWYDGESLTFDFAIPEGECTLTVTDASTAMQTQYVFDTETTAEVYVGPMAEAYLELYTWNCRKYI